MHVPYFAAFRARRNYASARVCVLWCSMEYLCVHANICIPAYVTVYARVCYTDMRVGLRKLSMGVHVLCVIN